MSYLFRLICIPHFDESWSAKQHYASSRQVSGMTISFHKYLPAIKTAPKKLRGNLQSRDKVISSVAASLTTRNVSKLVNHIIFESGPFTPRRLKCKPFGTGNPAQRARARISRAKKSVFACTSLATGALRKVIKKRGGPGVRFYDFEEV